MPDSYASKYSEPVKRESANGAIYTVPVLKHRAFSQWVSEAKNKAIEEQKLDAAGIVFKSAADRLANLKQINDTEFTPSNIRRLIYLGVIDAVTRVLTMAGEALGLEGEELEAFVDGTSTAQNEKDAFRISGLFTADAYLEKFPEEAPSFVRQLWDAALSGDDAAIVRVAKEAVAAHRAAVAANEAETESPNDQRQSQA
jgi:hypothetical protein